MFKFNCPRCGNPGTVPFEPSNPERILCSACHEETGGKTYDLSRAHKAPRRKHNTRVVIHIVCAECHQAAELDYAPKGVPYDQMKCPECLAKEHGDSSRWAMIRELKNREQKLMPRKVYTIQCAACHCDTELFFRPDPEKIYYCPSCYANDGVPLGPTHREGNKEKLRPNLFVRKRRVVTQKNCDEQSTLAEEE